MAPSLPGDPACPAPPPSFHPVRPMGRPDAATRAAIVKLVDGIGLHLICAEARCRRARRCADQDTAQLPLCFWLHRGTCRFAAEFLGARMNSPPRHAEERPEGASRSTRDGGACFETPAAQAPQHDAVGSVRPSQPDLGGDSAPLARRRMRPADTVLGRLARAGWPIGRLARGRADGADEWCWEREPDFAALIRDARAGRPSDGGTGDGSLRSPADTGD